MVLGGTLGAAGAVLDIVGVDEAAHRVTDPAAEITGGVGDLLGRVADGVLGLAVEILG